MERRRLRFFFHVFFTVYLFKTFCGIQFSLLVCTIFCLVLVIGLLRRVEKVASLPVLATELKRFFTCPVVRYSAHRREPAQLLGRACRRLTRSRLSCEKQTDTACLPLVLKCNGCISK